MQQQRQNPETTAESAAVYNSPCDSVADRNTLTNTMSIACEFRVVHDSPESPHWDHFLANSIDGHHVQTSLWAKVKAQLGWRAVRIEVWKADRIVGGLQLLLREMSVFGTLGYVPKGPIVSAENQDIVPRLIKELLRVTKQLRTRYVIVQPADQGANIAEQLVEHGLRQSPLEAFPIATTALDFTPPLEQILANMKSKTRYNIRYAARHGVTVRPGDAADVPLFHRLLMATAQRQGFEDYSLDYFEQLYDLFAKPGYAQLFVAEFDEAPVAALLAIPFGSSVLFKKGGWSGEAGHAHPNEAMHWAAIQWAKANGYQSYDFEGINSQVAHAIIHDQPVPKSLVDSVTRFKLGFGGGVQLVPPAYGYVANSIGRWAHNSVLPRLVNIPVINRFLNGLKTR